MSDVWKPESWKQYEARQQPDWPSTEDLAREMRHLASYPPLVFAGEVRNLTEALKEARQRAVDLGKMLGDS